MVDNITNILMTGVGGQGVILASDLLTEVLLESGFDAKKSEVHGMAQRGGSVVSNVRFGKKVFSPLIQNGCADILFSLELLESLRYIDYLNKDSIIIINDYRLKPPSVSLGTDKYPDGIYELLKKTFPKVSLIKGLEIATKLGNPKAVGTVVMGHLSNYLDIDKSTWVKVLNRELPKKILDVNLKAFEEGRAIERV